MATKSIVRKHVPNYSQKSVIAADLIRVRDNENPGAALSWEGNSYEGFRETYADGTVGYFLRHWNTIIAALYFEQNVEKVVVSYFNARYISATTRGFQSRILDAFDRVGVWGTQAVRSELSKPTHKRGLIVLDPDSFTHKTI